MSYAKNVIRVERRLFFFSFLLIHFTSHSLTSSQSSPTVFPHTPLPLSLNWWAPPVYPRTQPLQISVRLGASSHSGCSKRMHPIFPSSLMVQVFLLMDWNHWCKELSLSSVYWFCYIIVMVWVFPLHMICYLGVIYSLCFPMYL